MTGNGKLTIAKKLSYGVGHVLNDLTASMWFSYLLIYLHRVIGFTNSLSGYMMLIGQVADAISTIFVGFESDRSEHGLRNYGRRKSWHLAGVLCVLFSFGFMFNLCPTCENAAVIYKIILKLRKLNKMRVSLGLGFQFLSIWGLGLGILQISCRFRIR
jgi:Na+/melibiose symporter-like transporter